MIGGAETVVPIVVSSLALFGAGLGSVLTYRAVARQARNAERNTDLDQVRTVNEAMRLEIVRLSAAEKACLVRLDALHTKLARVETRFEESREEMREMRSELMDLRKAPPK